MTMLNYTPTERQEALAAAWSIYLEKKVTATDVAVLMALAKEG